MKKIIIKTMDKNLGRAVVTDETGQYIPGWRKVDIHFDYKSISVAEIEVLMPQCEIEIDRDQATITEVCPHCGHRRKQEKP